MEHADVILQRVLDHLPIDPGAKKSVKEETSLAELGVASLHLITLLLQLQREFCLDGESLVDADMPSTIGELVRLIQRSPRQG